MQIDGETRAYKGRHFCPRCGSSVFARYGDEVEVHLGSFDARDQYVPTYEIGRSAGKLGFPLSLWTGITCAIVKV